jgi:hypothetical protein
MKHFLGIAVFGSLLFISCKKDKTIQPVAGPTIISYSTDIRPIIESSCKTQAGPGTGCHDAWIDDYPTIKSFLDAGSWQTEIWVDYTMPEMPNVWGIDSLTEEEIQTMKDWVDQGYPEN